MIFSYPHTSNRAVALNIVLIYALVGSVWILFSDRLLHLFVYNSDLLTKIQTIKGWFFIGLTSILLYFLVKRNWRDLQRSYNLLETILEGTTDAIFVKNLQGQYILVNSTTAKLLGRSIPEILGRDDTAFVSAQEADKIMKNDRIIMQIGQTEMIEEVMTLNQQTYTYLVTKDAYRDRTGKIIGLIGISRNITERKRIQDENLELIQALTREREDLAALSLITANSLSTLNLDELLNILLTRIIEVMKAETATILLNSDGQFKIKAYVGPESVQFPKEYSISIGVGFVGKIVATQKPLYVEDAQVSSLITGPYLKQAGIRSMLGVPLKHHNEIVGVLHVDWLTIHAFSQRELNLLEVTAESCTTAILNAQLYEETKRLKDLLELQINRMPIGCILNDQDFNILDWNPAAEKIFGFTKAEVLGKNPFNFIIPEVNKTKIQKIFRRLLNGDMQAHSVNENLTKEHKYITCHWHNTPLKDEHDTVIGVLSMVEDISDRIQAERDLKNSEKRYRQLFESNPHPMWVYDNETYRFLAVNDAAIYHYGYSQSEFLEMTVSGIFLTEDMPALQFYLNQSITDFQDLGIWRNLKKDGTLIYSQINVHQLDFNIAPGITRSATVAFSLDVTERLQATESLRQSQEQLRSIIQNMPVLMNAFDEHGNIIVWNQECEQVTGYLGEEVLYNPQIMELLYPDPSYQQKMLKHWKDQGNNYRNWEWNLHCKDGSVKTIAWSNISDLFPIPGWKSWGIGVDVSDRKKIEEQLRYEAFYDRLTGLPNRKLCLEEIAKYLASSPDCQFTLVLLELESIDTIKYTLGHLIAEQLLISAAQRLKQSLRPQDLLAQVETNEFAILLKDVCTLNQAFQIVNLIQKTIKVPFTIQENEFFLDVNIGLALGNLNYQQPEDFLRAADTAKYQAKILRSSRPVVFETTMHEAMLTRLQLEADLRRAIESQAFQVYYQPIISLAEGKIVGFEALIRWVHPQRGNVSPLEFILLAEERGLVTHIDRWVIRQACQQLKDWQQELPDLENLVMSVNLSVSQLSQVELIQSLKDVLSEIDLCSNSLKLEITESEIFKNPHDEIAVLKQLKTLGIGLSIDDFGTGYSSLGRLSQLPIDTLKIDRSFVERMATETEGLEFVRTIITLAHTLEIDVVAEGIETNQQLNQLRALNCEYGQGYFFSPPVNSEQARTLLIEQPFRT